jgi:hypothetical protein
VLVKELQSLALNIELVESDILTDKVEAEASDDEGNNSLGLPSPSIPSDSTPESTH